MQSNAFFAAAGCAGLCGALSGIAVKVAVGGSLVSVPAPVVFAVFMALNAALTGLMWRYYLKALNLGPTPATMMVTTAVNMSISAGVGVVVFGEHLSAQFVAGSAVMVVGLAMIATQGAPS